MDVPVHDPRFVRPSRRVIALGVPRVAVVTAWGLVAAAILTVTLCLLTYRIPWMHPEIYVAEQRHLAQRLYWTDALRAFDCHAVSDRCHRTRFLSYLVAYVNSHTRVWLWRYLPPHPSLSLTWPLSFASLFLFYAVIKRLADDCLAAQAMTAFYAVSVGFLSSIAFLFNPAKPLAAFFALLTLWLAGRAADRPTVIRAILLGIVGWLSYMTDETAWILYGAVPLVIPALRRRWWLAGSWALTFPAFLIFVTWIVPAAAFRFWGATFEFWGWAFNVGRRAAPDQTAFFERLRWSAIVDGAHAFVSSQFPIHLVLLGGLVVGAIALTARSAHAPAARAGVALIAFTLFQTLISFRQASEPGYTLMSTYYYGSLFPIFALLVVGVLLGGLRHRPGVQLSALAVVAVLMIQSTRTFLAVNDQWQRGHVPVYAELLHRPATWQPLQYQTVLAVWRRDLSARDALGPNDAWLALELSHQRSPRR